MRTIATRNKLIAIYLLLATGVLAGCVKKEAGDYAQQSQAYYQRAVSAYKELILKGENLDSLYLQLGSLYYAHGDFGLAIEELKKTANLKAKKLLAISYYRLANFTDALEIFGKQENIADEETLYYYGLTCEKLNLFDKALDIYKKIKGKEFLTQALGRRHLIEKQVNPAHISEINSEIARILEASDGQGQYPQAGALVLFCDERIEVTPQNSQISTLHYLVKILNERGKESFSETHIDYDATYEKVELVYARTIRPDGQVADVGSRHIRDVSKYLNFPLYSNVRVYIISFPEITEGASIEYKVKIYRNQLINKKDFVISYPVQTSEPIISANFNIYIPKDKTLYLRTLNDKYNNFNAELSPKIQEESERLIYSWQFKDIPQIIPEANMPASVEINPVILISTFSNWQDIYNWWWGLAGDKINADQAIIDKVKELNSQGEQDETKIRAIYNFCAQKIRYVAVEYGEAGHQPHLAGDIFKNKYGDCKDQAILLVAMLKAAGFKAYPVLISTKDYYNLNPDFPSVLFNHCIAAVELKDKLVFLDPTAETCSFGDLPVDDQNRGVLIFKEESYEINNTPLFTAGHNLIRQELKIKVNSDETIVGEKTISTNGVYDQAERAWLLYTPPELIGESINQRLQEVSIGAKMENYSVKNMETLDKPVVLSYKFGGPEYFTAAGSARIMPQLAFLDTAIVAKENRRYPIDFAVLDSKEIIFEIELPDNFVIKYLPPSLGEESPWLKLNIEYSRMDNKIYCKQKIEAKETVVLESEYQNFKDFFIAMAKKIKQRIVLERKD